MTSDLHDVQENDDIGIRSKSTVARYRQEIQDADLTQELNV